MDWMCELREPDGRGTRLGPRFQNKDGFTAGWNTLLRLLARPLSAHHKFCL